MVPCLNMKKNPVLALELPLPSDLYMTCHPLSGFGGLSKKYPVAVVMSVDSVES